MGGGNENGGQLTSPYNIPSPPSITDLVSQYGQSLPQILSLLQQYGPQFDAYGLQSLRTYGPQYAQAQYDINKQLYPYSTGLQEQLAQQASEGMGSQLPASLRSQYLDTLRAELGTNAGSPIGGDYVSRGLLNQGEQYKNYYQNLGLSLTNRVPISMGQNYSPSNAGVGGFGLPQYANWQSQNYGNYLQGLNGQNYYQRGGGNNWMGQFLPSLAAFGANFAGRM